MKLNTTNHLQQGVIKAALSVSENAAYLPDGNAQVSTEKAEQLGNALLQLAIHEEDKYRHLLKGKEQTGLNSIQVSLQRLTMSAKELKIEQIVDLADRMYLSFFDQVIIPGNWYHLLPADQVGDVRFLHKEIIEEFLSLYHS